jgi:hypothetical protein
MRTAKRNLISIFGVAAFLCVATQLSPYAAARRRREPPVRDPHAPGYVEAKELPDGDVPPADPHGNFIVGPTHRAAPASPCGDSASLFVPVPRFLPISSCQHLRAPRTF